MNKWVTLSRAPISSPDSDGFFEDLNPAGTWAQIEPFFPGASADSSRVTAHSVRIRYHPQVTVDTRIVFGTRELFVKGVQNINEANAEMVLYCEEVAT